MEEAAAVILAVEEGTISAERLDVLEWVCPGAPELGAVAVSAGAGVIGMVVAIGTDVTGMDAIGAGVTGTDAIGTAIGIIITATTIMM